MICRRRTFKSSYSSLLKLIILIDFNILIDLECKIARNCDDVFNDIRFHFRDSQCIKNVSKECCSNEMNQDILQLSDRCQVMKYKSNDES